ncbi:hypothetical protein [Deinococcus arcticus]|uniref:Uncharacterized protein n=1 Tax=Deinococcus arcticus TaxID=2136176 RepID=A0A2T3W7I9_9DEIO|nr:hypothetical protein [Deinococcus arcticus]PTA67865.1 hypothetical protein C8263_10680 [Deinococcus arcticus]
MDGDIVVFSRADEEVRAYAQWETVKPEVLARGETGFVRIVPMHPPLWTHLQPGQSLHLLFARLSLQIIQPLTEVSV